MTSSRPDSATGERWNRTRNATDYRCTVRTRCWSFRLRPCSATRL
ncbi:hypothetical protein ACFPRL_16755 [Pseudoclavibacter helvolus]